jgi:hypothetical protein
VHFLAAQSVVSAPFSIIHSVAKKPQEHYEERQIVNDVPGRWNPEQVLQLGGLEETAE